MGIGGLVNWGEGGLGGFGGVDWGRGAGLGGGGGELFWEQLAA